MEKVMIIKGEKNGRKKCVDDPNVSTKSRDI
jgi:hypothetical protein